MRNLDVCTLCGLHFPESEPLVPCTLCQSLEAGQVDKRDWPQCISCGKIYKYLKKDKCEATSCRSPSSATMTTMPPHLPQQAQSNPNVNVRAHRVPTAASEGESTSEDDSWSENDEEILPPSKPKSTDIFVSIHPENLDDIVSQRQNHEFRNWKFPSQRIWIYVTRPVGALQYCAVVGIAQEPGEIPVDDRENQWFNRMAIQPPGTYQALFAHKILKLYRVRIVPLAELKQRDWTPCPPQKYHWAKQEMVDEMRRDWVEIF